MADRYDENFTDIFSVHILVGWLPWDPVFDGIRSDPRYDNLVRRLNLPASPE